MSYVEGAASKQKMMILFDNLEIFALCYFLMFFKGSQITLGEVSEAKLSENSAVKIQDKLWIRLAGLVAWAGKHRRKPKQCFSWWDPRYSHCYYY